MLIVTERRMNNNCRRVPAPTNAHLGILAFAFVFSMYLWTAEFHYNRNRLIQHANITAKLNISEWDQKFAVIDTNIKNNTGNLIIKKIGEETVVNSNHTVNITKRSPSTGTKTEGMFDVLIKKLSPRIRSNNNNHTGDFFFNEVSDLGNFMSCILMVV